MSETLALIDGLLIHYPLTANSNLLYDDLMNMHPQEVEHHADQLEQVRMALRSKK